MADVKPLTEWTDQELAAVLLSQMWRWLDAGGMSEGRSYDAAMLEAARDLLRLPLPRGDVIDRPVDELLLREAARRRLKRMRDYQVCKLCGARDDAFGCYETCSADGPNQ